MALITIAAGRKPSGVASEIAAIPNSSRPGRIKYQTHPTNYRLIATK